MLDKILKFWNHMPEHIDPVLFQAGQFQVRYYGLMYVVAFSVVYMLVMFRIRHEKYEYSGEQIQNYFMWAILGVIVGGRLGYVLFYNFSYYSSRPLEIILPFTLKGGFHYTGIGGMSYHGGMIAVILATIFFCRSNKISFWRFTDLLAAAIPLGYTFGRLGNFLNGELYGRITDVPWGMYFPLDMTGGLRHPSQLYEAFFEGIFLFVVLWSIRKRNLPSGSLFALYIAGYGLVRFFIEFVREPDTQLGFITGPFTMGQILCFLMMAGASVVFIIRKKADAKAVSG
ncbi:MAG TPA: prolipoprotein diacylglyceryl transferase [Nitrospirae bacterium]|nr:prolipoprotein diacylglyceryl transferase [Nitrospirota bacterium]